MLGSDLHARRQERLGRRQPMRHVHRLPGQLHLGTVPFLEGQGLPLDLQGTAVHAGLQQWVHRDIDVTGQIGHKRHAHLQLLHPVLLLQNPVGVAQQAVTHFDVENRKTRGLGIGPRLRRWGHQAGHHRADVELIGRLTFQPEHGFGQSHAANDRREVTQGGQRQLRLRLLQREPGGRCGPHSHAVHLDGQRPGLDAHGRHLHWGAQRFGGCSFDAGPCPIRQPHPHPHGPDGGERHHAHQGLEPGTPRGCRSNMRSGVRMRHRARHSRAGRP